MNAKLRIRHALAAAALRIKGRSNAPRFASGSNGAQNAADLFRGEWIGSFPQGAGAVAGDRPLYSDPRIDWLFSRFPVSGLRVVELGPLEAAHTFRLAQAGARSVDAIEANTRAYLKCLVAKEVLGLDRARFHCADFLAWLEAPGERFDLCLASGVLYHMTEPLRLLAAIAARCDAAFLWTHYYDPDLLRSGPGPSHLFRRSVLTEYRGIQAQAVRRNYGAQSWNPLHLGGRAPYSLWMPRGEILKALRAVGFDRIEIGPEDPGNPAGPAFSLLAKRTGGA